MHILEIYTDALDLNLVQTEHEPAFERNSCNVELFHTLYAHNVFHTHKYVATQAFNHIF